MSISGISGSNNNAIFQQLKDMLSGNEVSPGSDDQIARAAAVAEKGFQQSLQAKTITNAYSAGKEVR